MYNEGTHYSKHTKSHGNFVHIESFQSLEDNEDLYRQKLGPHDQIRLDLLTKSQNPEQTIRLRCYQTCFKLSSRSLIEFCLQRKCNSTFDEGASALGLKR